MTSISATKPSRKFLGFHTNGILLLSSYINSTAAIEQIIVISMFNSNTSYNLAMGARFGGNNDSNLVISTVGLLCINSKLVRVTKLDHLISAIGEEVERISCSIRRGGAKGKRVKLVFKCLVGYGGLML